VTVPVRVVVVGSLNHDITVWVPRRPAPDETLHGSRVAEFRGGKGANQAVAASLLGAQVAMVGSVGRDARAAFLLEGLEQAGVDHEHVQRVDEPTGTALITVDPDDVSIVVVAGANASTGPELVERARVTIAAADVLLLQGEVGAEAAVAAAKVAGEAGTLVVFNPAPFNEVAAAAAPFADVLVVNRQEAAQLAAALPTPRRGLTVTTLGSDGCAVLDGVEEVCTVEAPAVEVVDPTGAGDAFVAGFAVRFAETGDPVEAARFAVHAGAIAVTAAGAQPSLPTRAMVEGSMS
jgi:ribokinase